MSKKTIASFRKGQVRKHTVRHTPKHGDMVVLNGSYLKGQAAAAVRSFFEPLSGIISAVRDSGRSA